MKVDFIHWNPRQPLATTGLGRLIPSRRRVNNFGDLLGPMITKRILELLDLDESKSIRSVRLLTVGSIMHFAQNGDIIWGTGVKGVLPDSNYVFNNLDVRAIRGPLSREFLLKKGIEAPPIFGDPALLLGSLWPRGHFYREEYSSEVLVVPNLNEWEDYKHVENSLFPQRDLLFCLQMIASSRFVTGTSLHAMIVAESLGIPARLIRPRNEPLFKYEDYYLGSGRETFCPAESVSQAVDLGGEASLVWSPNILLDAFPRDLWRSPTQDSPLSWTGILRSFR